MSKLLERAIEMARALPSDTQDEIARAILNLAGCAPIDAAYLPAALQGLAEAKRREFAGDAEIDAAFRKGQ
jgi:hypothetical protein